MSKGASRVLFASPKNVSEAIPRLIEESGFLAQLRDRQRIGIKVHFGEDGNNSHLPPEFVRAAVSSVRSPEREVALLETCTLYRGARATRDGHIALAHSHGFTRERTGAEIVITDGVQGEDYYEVPLNSENVKNARLGRGLKRFSALVNMAHFKGHLVTGFGGVLKNLAMGLAAKGGKLEMHSESKPLVRAERCTGCEECVVYCPHDAIALVDGKARIGLACVGCAGCLMVCKAGAISINWNRGSDSVMHKVAEYAAAVTRDPTESAPRVVLNMNFALKITPNCDCMGKTEKPIMPDVGVFASLDPVACEQAAYDRTRDALSKVYPQIGAQVGIDHAEKIGLGSKHYELVEVS